MPKRLAMISAEGIERCLDFIYRKVLEGPIDENELAKAYIETYMSKRQYTDQEINNESANFGSALGLLIDGRHPHRRIVLVDGKYKVMQ